MVWPQEFQWSSHACHSATRGVGLLGIGICLRLGSGSELAGDLGHDNGVLLHLLQLHDISGILGSRHALKNCLHCVVALLPLVDQRLGGGFARARLLLLLQRLLLADLGRRLALGMNKLLRLVLALAALDGVDNGDRGRRHSIADVVVDSLHVIAEIPLAREAMALLGALAAFIGAQERLVSVAVQAVSLALVAETAGSGREASLVAALHLALIWLQVRINIFAKRDD